MSTYHAKSVPFGKLKATDLTVEAVYEGGTAGNVGDDPLGRLVPIGNQGGFRYAGSPKDDDLRLVVLYTSGENPDWPDALDVETGLSDSPSPAAELS
jgi:hypothetical protein